MAGYRGATRLGAQPCSLAHGTVCWPTSGGARPAVFETWDAPAAGITARPQTASGK
jgi:hypothetical protein